MGAKIQEVWLSYKFASAFLCFDFEDGYSASVLAALAKPVATQPVACAGKKRATLQGRVVVRFVVDATGQIASPEIVRSLSAECDAEVLRVVRLMPKWRPGKHEGKNVDATFTLPVMFRRE